MEDSPMEALAPAAKRTGVIAAAVILGITGLGYALHEHHAAQHLTTENQQGNAQLTATRAQLSDLTAKVNQITAQQTAAAQAAQASQAQQQAAAAAASVRHVAKPHAGRASEARWKKMQAQLDQQQQEIQQTRGDLTSTATQLSGSIAHTHDELVVLERRGERSYFEFDIDKSKQFKREGPVGVSLHKANVKHQYADLQLMVDDRNLVQKHVNLDQPVMFFVPDTEQPIQIVINGITKDHIHGYVSAPKYRKSELAAMDDATAAGAQDAAANPVAQPAPRKRLTVAQQDGPQ
ncbi:MAG: hypothetical protein WA294_16920 [Acidobacteriaceae bacterium]